MNHAEQRSVFRDHLRRASAKRNARHSNEWKGKIMEKNNAAHYVLTYYVKDEHTEVWQHHVQSFFCLANAVSKAEWLENQFADNFRFMSIVHNF